MRYPRRPMPPRTAASNASSLQLPIPVSRSGVIFGATMLPNGVSIGRPPANGRLLPGTVWQLAQSDSTARYRPRSIWVNSCGSDSPANADDASIVAARPPRMIRRRLRIDQSPRIRQVAIADRIRSPICEGADRQRWVIAGVLREGAGPEHEQIRHVPALQISVERAGLGIAAHDSAAVDVRCLILADVIRRSSILFGDVIRAHRLDDLGELVGQKLVLFHFVVVQVHRDLHQGPAETVLISGIEP